MRIIALISTAVLIFAVGSAAGEQGVKPPHFVRGCPRGEQRGVPFQAALKYGQTSVYGQKFQVQGQTYISGPRNTELWAAMFLFGNLSVIPGQQALVAEMRRRCGKHAPYYAWAFVIHRFFVIVPDYDPVFVTRTTKGWYVF